MSRPVFLADNDFNEHITDGLLRREPTINITRVRDYELQKHPDENILQFAANRGLIVISHDVNTMPATAFARIDAGLPLPGLIMVRQSLPVALVIDNLLLIWSATEAEEWARQVWFLPI